MSMSITRSVNLGGGLDVEVRELTVAEIRGWMAEPTKPEEREFDLLTDLMSFDGIGMDEIHRFTNLKREVIETLPPSQLAKVAAVIKELNAVFFDQYLPNLNKLRDRLVENNTKSAS